MYIGSFVRIWIISICVTFAFLFCFVNIYEVLFLLPKTRSKVDDGLAKENRTSLASEEMNNKTPIEHLSLIADFPVDLPKIEMGKNVFEMNAFTMTYLKEKQLISPHIIYVLASSRNTTKMIMFMNREVFNPKNTNNIINLIGYNDASAELGKRITSMIPIRQKNFVIKSNKKSEFVKEGNNAWKSSEKLIFCILINENDKDAEDLSQKLNPWQLLEFDYLSLINNNRLIAKMFPYAKIEGFQMRMLFPEKKDLQTIIEVMSFDKIVFVDNDGNIMNTRRAIRDKIIRNLQKYYHQISIDESNDKYSLNMYRKLGMGMSVSSNHS